MLATVGSGAYHFVLVLHITAAIVGFGAVTLNAIYAQEIQKRQGPEGLAVFDANERVANIGEMFIYAVALFGIILVMMSDDYHSFGDTWVWLAILVYAAAITIVRGIHFPNLRRMRVLMGELVAMGPPPAGAPAGARPPQVAELEERGKRAAIFGTLLNLMLVTIIFLMIYKPGGNITN
jgi:hypothetical protein